MTETLINVFTAAFALLIITAAYKLVRIFYLLLFKETKARKRYAFIPFHHLMEKNVIGFVFYFISHLLLILLPFTANGHVLLIEESFLHLSLPSIPDEAMDIFTIIIVAICFLFIIKNSYKIQTWKEMLERQTILLFMVMPFVTGYMLSNTNILPENIYDIHIYTAIILIIFLVFISIKIRILDNKCIGCLSCSISCPSNAIKSYDNNNLRNIRYQSSQCVSCGNCINTCPYDAVKAYHGFSISKYIPKIQKRIMKIDLQRCNDCGKLFATDRQVEMIGKRIHSDNKFYELCPDCRAKRIMNIANIPINKLV